MILIRCLDATGILEDDQGTQIGTLQPDFGVLWVLLRGFCVFRGEEKRNWFKGKPPKEELKDKTQWVYNLAPYILGSYLFVPE